MKGLYHLRKFLNLNGDEFGELFGVKRSAISRWEDNNSSIPGKNQKKIVEIFNCSPSLLEREVDDDPAALDEIKKVAERYLRKIERSRILTDDIDCSRAIEDIEYNLKLNPQLISKVKTICDIWMHDREIVNILMAGAEKYRKGVVSNLNPNLKKSEYYNDIFSSDDPHLTLICTALELALGKYK